MMLMELGCVVGPRFEGFGGTRSEYAGNAFGCYSVCGC
jgi:hypothetical protein